MLPIVVGDKYAPIIKILPHKTREELQDSDVFAYEAKSLMHAQVNKESLNVLSFKLMDVSGKKINFRPSIPTCLTLLFTKDQNKTVI